LIACHKEVSSYTVMARLNLKNILSVKSDAFALVSSLVKEMGSTVYIQDSNRKVLLGDSTIITSREEAVRLDEEVIGWVNGDDKVVVIRSLLDMFIQKEAERRKLGSEVLTLYQEVNLIFNFSEHLAQTIGQQAIAGITLDEARRLVKSDHGMIILWDEAARKIDVLAESGTPVFNHAKMREHSNLFLSASSNGQSDIMGDLLPLKEVGVILPEVQSLLYAALKVKHRVMGAIILDSIEPVQYSAADLKFLITLALQSSSAIESALLYEKNIREAKEREEAMRRVYEVTNKFVPHEFIRSLGRSVITDIQLGDQVEKIVTVLFSDIRDYTTLAEQMTPEENFSFVCSFNERIGPIIREHHGFINQYLGDAIMAIFPGNASDALSAAIKMQEAVETLNANRALLNKTPIKIGVGMHTGPLIMGITGDNERMDATTIADAVNTASRLESLTKHYKVNILLSEASLNNLVNPEAFHLRHLGSVQVKGKLEPISIHECINSSDENDMEKKLAALPIFKTGMMHYFNQSFNEATNHFSRVLEIYPQDATTKLFLEKAKDYINTGLPGNWTGVEEMHSK
jgi:adenylate cyclase